MDIKVIVTNFDLEFANYNPELEQTIYRIIAEGSQINIHINKNIYINRKANFSEKFKEFNEKHLNSTVLIRDPETYIKLEFEFKNLLEKINQKYPIQIELPQVEFISEEFDVLGSQYFNEIQQINSSVNTFNSYDLVSFTNGVLNV